jgi:hypothetical protein
VLVSAAACGGSSSASLKELQRTTAGSLDVVLLSAHESLRHGSDQFVIEFRSKADGALVDVGDIRVSGVMPMPGAPMLGSVDVKRGDQGGRYRAESTFEMAGTWRLSIEWRQDGAARSVSFSGTVL